MSEPDQAKPADARNAPIPPSPSPNPTIKLTFEAESELSERIGRYKLLQKIGEGGCGVVYMAEQEEPVRRRVALKVIKPGMDTKQVLGRFEAERQALALMDHPNIAKVFDGGATDNGRPFFVMEMVKGVRITDYCDENKLSTQDRLALFSQVCQAIQHAHQKGIIHRDIKPSNILVADHDGMPVPKVIDFGIAKATAGQTLTDKTLFTALEQFIGTPAYMSPEQARMSGLDIDTRSDIYSLGVLLYELLTGKTPFDAKRLLEAGLDEIRRIIREEEPPRPSTRLSTLDATEQTILANQRHSEPPKLVGIIRGDLDWIVMKALEKDRTRRYETANGLAMDIQRHLNNEPVVARPPSRLYSIQKFARRNKLAAAAAAVVVAALVIGLSATTSAWLFAMRASRKEKAALSEVRKTLASSDFLQATRLISEQKDADALAYLTRSLSLNPSNYAAAMRIITLLSYRAWPRPILTCKSDRAVESAQFSGDGRRIVTSLGQGKVLVWDAQGGQPLDAHPPSLYGHVNWFQFSPDGNWVATESGDGTVKVWNMLTGQVLPHPFGHHARVKSARFSADSQRIVITVWEDRTVRVWDVQSGQLLTEAPQHTGEVLSAQFSPDGKRVVTTSRDRTARVWDVQSGKPLALPLQHSNAVTSAEFSPDGKRVVTASEDGTGRIWDAQSGRPLVELPRHRVFSDATRSVMSAQFSPDGKRILAEWIGSAWVWDAQRGLEPLRLGDVSAARFSPDGSRIVTASDDGTARVWDAQSGQPLTEPLRHAGPVGSAQFSPDGKRLLTASDDGTSRVWDGQAGQALVEQVHHDGLMESAQFSPDGKHILTVSMDNRNRQGPVEWISTVLVWDAQSGQALTKPLKINGRDVTAQFSPDGKRFVTAGEDGNAVWDAGTGRALTESLKHKRKVWSAEFSPDSKRILTVAGGVRVWDAQSGQPLTEPLEQPGGVTSACFSPDGSRIVTTSDDGIARLWDAQSGQPGTKLDLHFGGGLQSARFSPDSKRILTVAGGVRVWDANSGRELANLLNHNVQVTSAEFSPDGTRLVTASGDGTAIVWDAQTGRQLIEPVRHNSKVNSAHFSPDGKWIVTASGDGSRVWDAQTGQPVTDPLNHSSSENSFSGINSAQFSPDGERVVTAGVDGTARVWDLAPLTTAAPEWLPKLVELIAGQMLNPNGVLEPSGLDPARTLEEIRRKLDEAPAADKWANWGRWFLADPTRRTISPLSKITVPEYVENWLKDNSDKSLAEAGQLAYGNAELLQRIAVVAEARKKTRQQETEAAALSFSSNFLNAATTAGIQARSADTPAAAIDLSAFYNADPLRGWTDGNSRNTLLSLPRGLQKLGGLQFDVRGIIQLACSQAFTLERFPKQVTGIKIDQRCKRLHFLHAAAYSWGLTNGTEIGRFVFHQAESPPVTKRIRFGEDVLDWWVQAAPWKPSGFYSATIVWTGKSSAGNDLQIFKSTWENSNPEAMVESFDYISAMTTSAPFLIAVTLEP